MKGSNLTLPYHTESVDVPTPTRHMLLKYNFQKIYYAIIIKNYNRYSSIANKQRVDVVMTDDNLKILSYKREMHENTFFANELATTTILLPLNYFPDLEIGKNFSLEEK